MNKDNFDEKLEEMLRYYVENVSYDTNEKVKFSSEYKKKKNEIIKTGRISESSETKTGNTCSFKVIHITKVAVFIILGFLAFIAVTPSITAWRTDKTNIYKDENGKYAWFLPNDITDVLENDEKMDVSFFEYLPEGFECKKFAVANQFIIVNLSNGLETITFKTGTSINNALDIEDAKVEQIKLDDISCWIEMKNGINTYVWHIDTDAYMLYGNLEKEELEKIIKNINYEKFKKISENMSLFEE